MEQDPFDRLLGSLHGLPDVLSSKATTIRTVSPLLGQSQTFIIQTYRQKDRGDTVFLELVTGAAHSRIILPQAVVNTIVRQRDALSTRLRKRISKENAQARMDAGVTPFQKRG